MITHELLGFYGLGDNEMIRNDFVNFLNGMLSFADAGRKETWTRFCDSLASTMKLLEETKGKYQRLEEKYGMSSQKEEEMKTQVRELLGLNDKLNSYNKDYVARIKILESELLLQTSNCDIARRAASKAEKELSIERQRTVKQRAVSLQPVDTDSSSVVAAASTDIPAGTALSSTAGVPSGHSASVADESQQRLHNTIGLAAENERLSGLIRSLAEYENMPVELFRGRVSLEEANKERKARVTLAAQLDSFYQEALLMSQKHTDIMDAQAAEFEKERMFWQNNVSDLKNDVSRLKDEAKKTSSSGNARYPSIFMAASGLPMDRPVPMDCPVPIRTGYLMQLRDIYRQWLLFPSDNEGTLFASFVCPATGHNTSLATIEQVNMVLNIAADLQLNVSTTPLVFQYNHRGVWFPFSYCDQIAITSMCCKMHRAQVTDGIETLIVCNGRCNLSIVVNRKIADLQMQPVHDSVQIVLVRLLDSTPNFFQLWSFLTHPDQVAAHGDDGMSA
jgi:hypothetical protein